MKVLLLNQAFYPDVVSTAQHLADLALGLIERGDEVTVICGGHGYDDGRVRFRKKEVWNGIEIIRVPSSSFGKGSRWRRALDFGSFMISCAAALAVSRKFDMVVSLTSPPLISVLGALFTKIRGGHLFSWVMDLNPDEAIAAGWLRSESLAARALSSLTLYSFDKSAKIIVLDRFMKTRVAGMGVPEEKIEVISPWSHDHMVKYDQAGRLAFREGHGLTGKFVVMHSGNHSPCHPMDTLLEAANRMSSDDEVRFCFVGGGSEMAKIRRYRETFALENITCLPYQPLEGLSASLSAADLHVVVMGDEFVGIVHPCKVYNIISLGIPLLYIGPGESHIGDLMARGDWAGLSHRADHGNVQAVVDQVLSAKRFRATVRSHAPAAACTKDVRLRRLIQSIAPETGDFPTGPRLDAPATVIR